MSRRAKNHFRPQLDALQARCLPAASILLPPWLAEPSVTYDGATQTIRIDGTYVADAALVSIEGERVAVRVSTDYGVSREYAFDLYRYLPVGPTLFRVRVVKEIRFQGDAGPDTFTNQTDIPAVAFGGAGNDTLTGGAGDDHLGVYWTGNAWVDDPGSDRIFSSAGNDFIKGGSGHDSVDGGTATTISSAARQ